MAVITTDYKGFRFEWQEHDTAHGWVIKTSDGTRATEKLQPTIAQCEKWVDNHLKVDYHRVKVFKVDHLNRFFEGEATSIVEELDYKRQPETNVWITAATGERSKESINSVILDTPEARATIARIQEKEKAISTLTSDIAVLNSALRRLTAADMTDEKSK